MCGWVGGGLLCPGPLFPVSSLHGRHCPGFSSRLALSLSRGHALYHHPILVVQGRTCVHHPVLPARLSRGPVLSVHASSKELHSNVLTTLSPWSPGGAHPNPLSRWARLLVPLRTGFPAPRGNSLCSQLCTNFMPRDALPCPPLPSTWISTVGTPMQKPCHSYPESLPVIPH